MLKNYITYLIGMISGFMIAGVAKVWANQSATDPDIVGANIGAGILGLIGLGIWFGSLLGLIIRLSKQRTK